MADALELYDFATLDGPDYRSGGPLLFVFHGTGGTEAQFLQPGIDLFPEARVIAPRGDVSENGALRFFRRTGEGQYDFEDLALRTEAMQAFVAGHVVKDDPSHVIGLGYSNGANILASVMDETPSLFTHAVMMHPLVTWEMGNDRDMDDLSVLITAGAKDPICPPDMTEKLADRLELRGASLKSHWHPGGHEITQDEITAISAWINSVRAGLTDPGDLEIRHEDDGTKGRYFVTAAGGIEAEMTYTRPGESRLIIDHTDVPEIFRGKDIGLKLLHALVADARKNGVSVVPLCPFAAAQFRRHADDFADVLDQGMKVKAAEER